MTKWIKKIYIYPSITLKSCLKLKYQSVEIIKDNNELWPTI